MIWPVDWRSTIVDRWLTGGPTVLSNWMMPRGGDLAVNDYIRGTVQLAAGKWEGDTWWRLDEWEDDTSSWYCSSSRNSVRCTVAAIEIQYDVL
nr:hypothetical protein [Tanacetum cinerariifolium]